MSAFILFETQSILKHPPTLALVFFSHLSYCVIFLQIHLLSYPVHQIFILQLPIHRILITVAGVEAICGWGKVLTININSDNSFNIMSFK